MPDRVAFDIDITLTDAALGWANHPIHAVSPREPIGDADEFDLDIKYSEPGAVLGAGNGIHEAGGIFTITCPNTCGITCGIGGTCGNTCGISCGPSCNIFGTCNTCNQATCAPTCQTCQTNCGQNTCGTCQTDCGQNTCQGTCVTCARCPTDKTCRTCRC
jgi:hypothetical protein